VSSSVDESRRGFLRRASEALVALAGLSLAAPETGQARYFTFCGHTFTTASCPHPTGLPRVDVKGYPIRAADGAPVDDLGRLVNAQGQPVDASGNLLLDPDGQPLPPALRSRLCADIVPERYGIRTYVDGSWHRCCGGHVRKLMDCCAYTNRRINGDQALTGYCFRGRKVFCVYYYDTATRC
jgi:hypothetical protein